MESTNKKIYFGRADFAIISSMWYTIVRWSMVSLSTTQRLKPWAW